MGSSASKAHDFEQKVDKAKTKVEKVTSYITTQEPYSGDYAVKYVDRNVTRTATMHLVFTPTKNNMGFTISGHGNDIDGSSIIEDGFARADGVAWWREKLVQGDVGLQVLSRGTFDFDRHTFNYGTWWASSKIKGPYLTFRPKQAPPSTTATAIPVFIPDQLQQQQQPPHRPGHRYSLQPQQHVPMVNAEIPIVNATPVDEKPRAGGVNYANHTALWNASARSSTNSLSARW